MNRSGRTRSPRILAIVPAHNEGPRIGAVVGMLVQQGLPVLVVDDGSSDDTGAAARAAGARVLSLRPNRGKGAALKAGFRVALGRQLADDPEPDGASGEGPAGAPWPATWDALLTLDGDGQHDPAEAPAFIERWSQTGADLVVGARDYREMPPIRWFTNSVSRVLFSSALGQRVPDNQSGYRLRSLRVAEASLESPEQGFAFEVEEIALCAGRGYTTAWVPIRTIYGTEVSDIKPWTHLVSFVRVTGRARHVMQAERRRSLRG
jgi:glycosyltransferase involved in cell wall biosynthesis